MPRPDSFDVQAGIIRIDNEQSFAMIHGDTPAAPPGD